VLDLDAPVTEWVPELTLADGRAGDVTARALLSHSSGLPDVVDYGWHDPQPGDDALSELARSLSGWRLQPEPGSAFSYSDAGYELLGLLLSRVTGTTFEDAVRQRVLRPLGMRDGTFLRSEVPAQLGASPHVGMPPEVPEGAYPYTRRHAPSSTLHSNPVEMCGGWWLTSSRSRRSGTVPGGQWARLDPGLLDVMRHPVVAPEDLGEGVAALGDLLPSVVCPVAEALSRSGPVSAAAAFHRLAAAEPAELDLDDEGIFVAVWGAIELHRTSMVWPLLRLWTELRPDSSAAWTMTGWAHQVDGDRDLARSLLRRALDLDPENHDAAQILISLSSG
jgi:hypothetical protein